MGQLERRGRTEVVVDASPGAVWRVVSDVSRVGEWGHECQGATWVGGATAAASGVRFRGSNRSGVFRWSRSCIFTVVDEPRELAWRTAGLLWGRIDSTEWRIHLEPRGDGTRIVQTFDVVRLSPVADRLYWQFVKAHRDRSDSLAGDLKRLGELAAAESRPGIGGTSGV